jgi:hypothetical protein
VFSPQGVRFQDVGAALEERLARHRIDWVMPDRPFGPDERVRHTGRRGKQGETDHASRGGEADS